MYLYIYIYMDTYGHCEGYISHVGTLESKAGPCQVLPFGKQQSRVPKECPDCEASTSVEHMAGIEVCSILLACRAAFDWIARTREKLPRRDANPATLFLVMLLDLQQLYLMSPADRVSQSVEGAAQQRL